MMFENCKRLALVWPLVLLMVSCGGDPEVGDVDPDAVKAATPDAIKAPDVDPTAPAGDPSADPGAELPGPVTAPDAKKTAADYPDLKIVTTKAAPDDAQVVTDTDRVKIHYTGYLLDGSMFDSSFKRGTPYPVNLAQPAVIQGWQLGIQGMKLGEKRRLQVPAELGYGARGKGVDIPPNSVLVFDIELVEIESAE